jgi:mannobiose 2-epimerase
MDAAQQLSLLRAEMLEDLTGNILPFWKAETVDESGGGFVGQITQTGSAVPDAPKGVVLNGRLLWTFASAADQLNEPDLMILANRAQDYLREHFYDTDYGGYFWTVDPNGRPLDTTKRVYAQAFVLYGLAAKVKATAEETTLDEAIGLFETIEKYGFDERAGGYFESFGRSWESVADMRLSERDDNAPKSMNTNLHVLEAYTALHRVWPTSILRERLAHLTEIFAEKIYDPETRQLHLFFESDWTARSEIFSYGHDIEASWLLTQAATELRDPDLAELVREVTLGLAETTARVGQDADGGVCWSGDRSGVLDTDKHHWVQAEAIVGFTTAFLATGNERYLESAIKVWTFVKEHIIDRTGGDWFGRVARDGTPYAQEDKLGLWKCPYHNSRAGLEILALTNERHVT